MHTLQTARRSWILCVALLVLGLVLVGVGLWPKQALMLLVDSSLWLLRAALVACGGVLAVVAFLGLCVKIVRGSR